MIDCTETPDRCSGFPTAKYIEVHKPCDKGWITKRRMGEPSHAGSIAQICCGGDCGYIIKNVPFHPIGKASIHNEIELQIRAASAGLAANIQQVVTFEDSILIRMEMYTVTILRSIIEYMRSDGHPGHGDHIDGVMSFIYDKLHQCIELISRLHDLGFAHGDTHLNNFMYDQQGHLKIIDFGLSVSMTQQDINHDYDLLLLSVGHMPDMPDEIGVDGRQSNNFFVDYSRSDLEEWQALKFHISALCLATRQKLYDTGQMKTLGQELGSLSSEEELILATYAEHLQILCSELSDETSPVKEDITELILVVRRRLTSASLMRALVVAPTSYAQLTVGKKSKLSIFKALIKGRNSNMSANRANIADIEAEEQKVIDIS